MQRQTWLDSLRGVRIYVFILATISFSLVGSLIHPQPASAEGFLGKTVRCVVGGLLLFTDCRTPAEQAPAPTSTPPAAEPQAAAPASPSATQPSPSRPQASPQSSAVEIQLAPLENFEPVVEAATVPALPSASHRSPSQPELTSFAMANIYTPKTETLGVSTSAFEPSSEGWRIAGVSWFWWLLGIGAVIGSGLWVKNRYKKTV